MSQLISPQHNSSAQQPVSNVLPYLIHIARINGMLLQGNAAAQCLMQPLHNSMVLPGSSSSSRISSAHNSSRLAAFPCSRTGRSSSSSSSTRCHHHVRVNSRHHSNGLLQQQQQLPIAAVAAAAVAAAGASAQQPYQQQRRQQQHPRRSVLAAAAAAAAEGPSSSSSTSTTPAPTQQQQHGLDLPPLDLPPSRSAALWLNDMSDAELDQAAADWGYVQVGRPLPEGISLTALAETLPDQVFTLDLGKALGYLSLSLGLMAVGYSYLWYWHSICPLWQQLLAWVVVGTGYYGVFQTAVDCAHFAFWPERPLIQDVVGAMLMAPSLMSYEIFRLKYFNHIM